MLLVVSSIDVGIICGYICHWEHEEETNVRVLGLHFLCITWGYIRMLSSM